MGGGGIVSGVDCYENGVKCGILDMVGCCVRVGVVWIG